MSSLKTSTLDNGLRVVTDYVPSMDSVAIGLWIGSGARHETAENNGVAHLVEHMLFKGTPTRTAQKIVESVESVGGQMNAYTSRDITAYHIKLLKDDAALGLDILGDMIQNSLLDKGDLEKERLVVLQEIGMYADTPDEKIFDDYQEVLFPDQALGAPILGRPDLISVMNSDTLRDYIQTRYSAKNIVVSAAGNIPHETLVDLAEQTFKSLPTHTPDPANDATYSGGEYREEKDLEQSHIILGFEGINRLDENFYAAQILSIILGGGMSSRLFQDIREKRGLVYSIYSFLSAYQETGHFGIHAGTGPKDIPELVPALCDQIMAITRSVTEEELKRAKTQMKAGLLMGRESMMARAGQQAKYLLYRDALLDVSELVSKIDAVTCDGVTNAAKLIFSTRPTLASLGPVSSLESYDSVTKRLAA